MVKLRNREKKNDLVSSARKSKPEGLFLNENLTPSRSTILYALRRAKRLHSDKISGCGSFDGKVYVWLGSSRSSEKSSKVYVNSMMKLETILQQTIGVGLENLLPQSTNQ